MPLDRLGHILQQDVASLRTAGTAKGYEYVVTDVRRPNGTKGPRFCLDGFGNRQFICMNSNSYLGLSLREELIHAEEAAARKFGVGPGAVRFISGTYQPHVELEKQLAAFHRREACMITSAAYTSVVGVILSLTTPETGIISDELNHNCIINGIRLAQPKVKKIYPHLNVAALENQIKDCIGQAQGLIVITDGIFSMRGAVAPLAEISAVVRRYDVQFPKNIVLMVDDSHGVGAFGPTGRGTEEYCKAEASDILVGTLGKAFGVNGGYIVSSNPVIAYLREKNPLYIYTNPITPSEAAAAVKSLELLQSDQGAALLGHLRTMTARFKKGLVDLGFETVASEHPVVPLFVRDTEKTTALVKFLLDHDILATGLNFPIVPKGDQLVRFQVSAAHTAEDIDQVLQVLGQFRSKL
jgi:glycine C-acetyltransferase